jgi:hypothetical protein
VSDESHVALNGELLRDLARFLRLPVEEVRQEPRLRLLPPVDDPVASRKAPPPLRLVTNDDKEVPF